MIQRIKPLPNWVLTGTRPAFYDSESATAIEQTAKLYGAMKELQEDYNKYVAELNQAIDDFVNGVNTNQEEFKNHITKIMHDYIAMVDDKLKLQDKEIEEFGLAMKENITETANIAIRELVESGEINHDTHYNTVADMKSSTTIIAGDIVQTLGYHSINDGGCATYKIRTKQDDVEDSGLIHLIGESLVAELIIDNTVNVKQFGAYGDNTHDDTIAFQTMYNKLGHIYTDKSTYKLANSLILQAPNIDINGKINYTGNEYCFIITGGSYFNVNVKTFESKTGGMFHLNPTAHISFNNFNLDYVECYKECFKVDGTNYAIVGINIYNKLLHSTNANAIELLINDGGLAGSFITEFNLYNSRLWGNQFGINAVNNDNSKEIQFNLFNCNLESNKTLQTTGKITQIKIDNCRTGEAVFHHGWLTFNDYLPAVELIGCGYLYGDKIVFNNVSDVSSAGIFTNLQYIDEYSSINYEMGGQLLPSHFRPVKYRPLSVWTQVDGNNPELPLPNKKGNMYNYFSIMATENCDLHGLNFSPLGDYYLNIANDISVNFYRGSNSTPTVLTRGMYKVKNEGVLGIEKLSLVY